jgi:hypothetical protein
MMTIFVSLSHHERDEYTVKLPDNLIMSAPIGAQLTLPPLAVSGDAIETTGAAKLTR